MEDAEQQKSQKDLHLHLQQKDLPVPAPAATLEKVHKRPHSKTAKKSTDNFGRPASMNSDFSYGLYLNLDLWIPSTILTFLRNCK